MMRAVIDRFEDDIAVLLFGEKELVVAVPRELLPSGAVEGDILNVSFESDPAATREQREKVEAMLRKLQEKNQ
jgi:hypothetical protein